MADVSQTKMKTSSDTCLKIDWVDNTITRDIACTDAVQTVDYEDIQVVCHLYSAAALPAQVLHTTHRQTQQTVSQHSITCDITSTHVV